MPIILIFGINLNSVVATVENRLKRKFGGRKSFSRRELFAYLRSFDPELKEGTLGWRIYDLKKRNIIKAIRRGIYAISSQTEYKPKISKELLKLTRFTSQHFAEIRFCLWDTSWLNEFAKHQAGKKFIVIEIEKAFVESLYYEMKDNFRFDFFLNPDETVIDLYITESPNPVIIKKFVTRSPVAKRKDKIEFCTPKLEKMLVDLYSESKLFYFYQGGELVHIFENAIKNYPINYTTLFSYAARRDKDQEIREFLKDNLYHLVKDVI